MSNLHTPVHEHNLILSKLLVALFFPSVLQELVLTAVSSLEKTPSLTLPELLLLVLLIEFSPSVPLDLGSSIVLSLG